MSLLKEKITQATHAHHAGELERAATIYREILATHPHHPIANHNLGVLLATGGKPNEALPFFKAAVAAYPKNSQFWISHINTLLSANLPREARAALEQAKHSELPEEAYLTLNARIRQSEGPAPEKIQELLQSYSAAQYEQATQLAKKLIQQFPDHPLGWKALGAISKQTGQLDAALTYMVRSVEVAPEDFEAHNNLGTTLRELRRIDEAENQFRHAIKINPAFPEAHSNLGITLAEQGKLSQAENCYREAIRLKPDYPEAYNNLGNALKGLNQLGHAQACYRKAISLKPDYTEAHSNLLFCLNYLESYSPEAALNEAQRYGEIVSARSIPKFTSWLAPKSPQKLRLGFVSGDFNNHPVGYFIEGLIKYLDRSQFELIAFPTAAKTDELTDRIKPQFKDWISIYGMNNLNAATVIQQCGIQILVDLSGHTAHNRLPVFAYKPAPIQVSWLGYFATTGLPEMDFFLGDPYMSPPNEKHHFSEQIWNLPETWLCLSPPSVQISTAALPALENIHITFGSFGNLSKMGSEVVMLWAEILRKIPNSKLFLKARQLGDQRVISDVQRQFTEQGIHSSRLILEGPSPRSEYLAAYNQVDVVLDTFPYPGGTTSTEALWMGVPVLTLKGNRFLSHLGESIAHNAEHSDWIAENKNDYINKAVVFTSDLEALAALRQTLREQVLETPLSDTQRFANNFGKALQGMMANARP